MPEHAVSHRTKEALDEIKNYTTGGNEPPAFTLSRLTDDMFTDSFLGGGAIINPSGNTLESEDSEGLMLASNGGAPTRFPISLSIDPATARASGQWTLPDGTAQSPSFHINYLETADRPEGRLLLFNEEGAADGAAYSIAVLLM